MLLYLIHHCAESFALLHFHFLCSYGSGSGRIWLDNVGCFGTESCLLSCRNNGIGVHNCVHSEDVAISCSFRTRFTSTDCSRISTSKFIYVFIGGEVDNTV